MFTVRRLLLVRITSRKSMRLRCDGVSSVVCALAGETTVAGSNPGIGGDIFLEIENNRELTVLLMYACINFTTSCEIYAYINYDVTAQ